MPHRRFEHWKYSDLRAVLDAGQVAQAGTAAWRIENLPDGVEMFDLAKPSEVPAWVEKYLGAVGNRPTMEEASLAFADGGVALRVTAGSKIAQPLRLQISSPGNTRVLIVLEEGAALSVMETHADDAGQLRNVGVEIALGKGATLRHVRCGTHAPKSIVIEHIAVALLGGVQYRAHFANFGARLSRTELHIVLQEKGAQAHLSGVGVLGGDVHSDVTSHIEHAAGDTQSTQLFKNVAGGKSRAVYQGKITVREGANGSDSRQTAKALAARPACGSRFEAGTHHLRGRREMRPWRGGRRFGRGILFYLCSRGIPEREARNLLVRAFFEEAVTEIEDETLRAEVWRDVEKALPRALGHDPLMGHFA